MECFTANILSGQFSLASTGKPHKQATKRSRSSPQQIRKFAAVCEFPICAVSGLEGQAVACILIVPVDATNGASKQPKDTT